MALSSLPGIITYFKSTAFVPFFTQTQRILDYAGDAISRVGLVTSPRAADMYALGKKTEVIALARNANRYCLTLWGLPASFLFAYGGDFFRVWMTKAFGDQAVPPREKRVQDMAAIQLTDRQQVLAQQLTASALSFAGLYEGPVNHVLRERPARAQQRADAPQRERGPALW